MPKLIDWERRLSALVTEAHGKPFAWGQHDCCTWAADCVLAQTGVDHADGIRGTYADARGSVEVLHGMGGLEGVGHRLGRVIQPLTAMHGDIGIVLSGERELMALCNGDHWLVTGTNGLISTPFESALMAWKA